ncbi:MAG: hypothetical protein ACOX2K_05525 [Bacillota bacterium]|jgi:hypothetical protein
MRILQLLRRSYQRLIVSGLPWQAVLWSAGSLLYFYWPSQLLLRPWSARLSAAQRLDFSVLRLLFGEAQSSGLLGWLATLFLLRLLLTPLVDVHIYQRLLHLHRASMAVRAFYRLQVLVMLTGGLLVCLLYASSLVWLHMLQYHPLRLALLASAGALLLWFFGFLISWRRSSLAAGYAATAWPSLSQVLPVALAQAVLSGGFGLLLLMLNSWMMQRSGLLLGLGLLLICAIRTYGRLWKLSCVISAWQDSGR